MLIPDRERHIVLLDWLHCPVFCYYNTSQLFDTGITSPPATTMADALSTLITCNDALFMRKQLKSRRRGGLMFCWCFIFYIFGDVCQTNNISTSFYRTDLHEICRIGRTLAVDDRKLFFSMPQGTLPWQPILWAKSISNPYMTFAWHSLGRRRRRTTRRAIAMQGAGKQITSFDGRRRTANQLRNKLTTTNRRLEGIAE